MIFSFESSPNWPTTRKWLFRFLFIYCLLYIALQLGGNRVLEPLLAWVGQDILGIEGRLEFFRTGSGDTTMAFISLFVQFILSLTGMVIWSIADKRRPAYNDLFYWYTVLLRVYLIFFMMFYGFAKIYKTQFAGPSLLRLMEPVGDMSPMGLAWTYMAFSEGFNVFTGFMEVLGALLLIPKRTQALGAIIVAAVMLQVFMMNMFYDIPVKLFSFHLMFFALIIFSADSRRFYRVFIANKPTKAMDYYVPTKDNVYHKVMVFFKVGGLVILLLILATQGYNMERSFGDKSEKPALYGIWEVEQFIKNGDTLPPLTTLEDRWRYLIIDRKDRAAIKTMNDQVLRYQFIIDSTDSKVRLAEAQQEINTPNFELVRQDSTQILLKGSLLQQEYSILLKARDLSKIRLINRGFHWINETPYNR